MENKEITLRKKEKKNYLKVIIIIVALALIFTLGYFAAAFENPYQTKQSCSQEINETIITVENYIIFTILNEAVKCELVPIPYQNQTYNLLWSDCLNAPNTRNKSEMGK